MAKEKDEETEKKPRQKFPNKSALRMRPPRNGEGRPREFDRSAVAKALIEWAKKEDSINLCGFCCEHEPPIVPNKLTEWSQEDDEFRCAYEIAKSFLGARREKHLNAELLHVKAYDLNATTYDYFLRSEKQRIAEYEHNLKLQQEAQIEEGIVEAYAKTINQLERIQGRGSSLKSALKTDKSKKSKDK